MWRSLWGGEKKFSQRTSSLISPCIFLPSLILPWFNWFYAFRKREEAFLIFKTVISNQQKEWVGNVLSYILIIFLALKRFYK